MQSTITRRMLGLGAAVVALGLASASPALAQAWPTAKPITIIVPYGAGTVTDYVGRLLADFLGKKLNQQVLVENRAGAGATIGAGAFAKAAPDGYTLLVTGPSPIVNAPLLYKTLSYDPSKFVPISMLMELPIMVVVNNDVPAKDLKELIAYAKANPGKLNAGETGNGSTHQLLHLILEKAAKIDLNLVSYKQTPILDLVAGRIDMILDYPGAYQRPCRGRQDPHPGQLSTTSAPRTGPMCRRSPKPACRNIRTGSAGTRPTRRPARRRISSTS